MLYKNNSSTPKKSRQKLLLLVAGALVITGGAGAFAYTRQKNNSQKPEDTAVKTPADKSVGKVPTKKVETEGKTVDIPKNVPEGAIKNYELITENETFKIRKLGDEYTVTLYAIINNPDQSSQYRDQLKEYKQNALDYLKQQGVDINTARIKYEPEEANDL